jgi:hypothetical protein
VTTTARPLSWIGMPGPVRALARWITIVQLVGYTTSLIFIRHTTGLTATGIEERYRGADPAAAEAAMQFPKSFAEMLTITHTHLFGMAAIFVFSGLALALCARPSERWRRVLIVEPFVALLVSFLAMWLMRYVDPRFSWVLGLSSGIMALTFYVQAFFILRELKGRPEEAA